MKQEPNRGGYRPNSGRKQKYSEPTITISFRCPKSQECKFKELIAEKLKELVSKA